MAKLLAHRKRLLLSHVRLLGVALASLDGAVILRAILGMLFLLLTTPVSAHLLARAAYRAGILPVASTNINDIAREKPN